MTRYMLFCHTCSYKGYLYEHELKQLRPVEQTMIQRNLPKLEGELTEESKWIKRADRYKCPECHKGFILPKKLEPKKDDDEKPTSFS